MLKINETRRRRTSFYENRSVGLSSRRGCFVAEDKATVPLEKTLQVVSRNSRGRARLYHSEKLANFDRTKPRYTMSEVDLKRTYVCENVSQHVLCQRHVKTTAPQKRKNNVVHIIIFYVLSMFH